jgi:hypothetical protein
MWESLDFERRCLNAMWGWMLVLMSVVMEKEKVLLPKLQSIVLVLDPDLWLT